MPGHYTPLSSPAGVAATMVAFALSMVAATAAAQTPRTPWGDPDLQGTYTNATQTPFERPEALGDKAFLTEEEAAELETRQAERFATALDAPAQKTEAGGDVGAYNEFWYDARAKVVGTRRTSLVVDPPDGRVPVRPEALAARDYHLERITDDYVHLGPWDRCIARGTPSNFFQSAYNNNYMILQTPDTVAIYFEMIHDVRVIPLDRRPHVTNDIELWNGDSRGFWEGDTLVVETTNLSEKGWISTSVVQGRIRGVAQTKDTRLVERFTRVDANTIDYQVTVTDPSIYTAPWTAQIPLYTEEGLVLYEYACHEGNWAVHNILSGGRADERAAATSSSPTAQSTDDWITLFDGSSLDGWNVIGDANWTLAEGAVQADTGAGFLVTSESYGDFQLTLEFWVGDDANSGVFIRCADPDQVGADNSYEINIADTHENPDYRTGSIVRLTPPARSVPTAGQWNTYEITARGSRITVVLNGIQTADVEDSEFVDGPFALQSREGTVKFRNVRIRPL